MIAVYDIEVYPNFFVATFKYNGNYHVFEVSDRQDDSTELFKFIKDKWLVGYNNKYYDDVVLNYFEKNLVGLGWFRITSGLFDFSTAIINERNYDLFKQYKYTKYKTIDLLTMMFSKALRVSLKVLEASMDFHNVQELPIRYDAYIQPDQYDMIIDYNKNDVEATEVLMGKVKDDLELRKFISQQYNKDFLSKDGVGIGVELFKQAVLKKSGWTPQQLDDLKEEFKPILVKDILLPPIKFESPEFQHIHERFKNLVIHQTKGAFKEGVVFDGLQHTYGQGGLHSKNKPAIYRSNKDYQIVDIDVASFYPSLVIQWGLAPKNIREYFLGTYKDIRDERVVAKRAGNKKMDATYKLSLNSSFGNMNNQYSFLYSPTTAMAITINGQLMLSMLIERLKLQAGISCIMSNTDGATFNVPRDKMDQMKSIVSQWEAETKMEMEYVNYESMFIYAVNDYLSVKEGYSESTLDLESKKKKFTKAKGMFVEQPPLGKGGDARIIAKAMNNYFLENIPVDVTIKKSEQILDFTMYDKVDKKFQVVINNVVQQQLNRYFVCKGGAYLYKIKDGKPQHMLKNFGVRVLNKLDNLPIKDRRIDYSYYISQCTKIISQVDTKQSSLW